MAAPLLYHEKQVSLLCGVHALNALLQGPYFSAHDLGTIAQEFDEKERQLMASAGVESADFLRYMAEDSGNAAANGNFSIQVLTRALEAWDLRCVPALSSSAGSAWREPQRERAFLCNLDQHWFAVRRCDARSATVHREGEAHAECNWWNFNSVFPAPQPISELYLAAFLAQLKDEGYAIFVVRGHLPPRFPDADAAASGDAAGEYGMWVSADDAAALNKRAEEIKNAGRARNAAESALAKIGAAGRTTLSVVGGGGVGPRRRPGGCARREPRGNPPSSRSGPGPRRRDRREPRGGIWIERDARAPLGSSGAFRVRPRGARLGDSRAGRAAGRAAVSALGPRGRHRGVRGGGDGRGHGEARARDRAPGPPQARGREPDARGRGGQGQEHRRGGAEVKSDRATERAKPGLFLTTRTRTSAVERRVVLYISR